jgi:hypothetical protein
MATSFGTADSQRRYHIHAGAMDFRLQFERLYPALLRLFAMLQALVVIRLLNFPYVDVQTVQPRLRYSSTQCSSASLLVSQSTSAARP